jgi:D-alanyl-D-alanine carboxypeptidase
VAACGGSATTPPVITAGPPASPTDPPTASAPPPVTTAPATTPPVTASPTALPTTPPAATPSGPAAYCAIGDTLTAQLDYARHAETVLDWTNALPREYAPADLVSALDGQPRVVPTPRIIQPSPADKLARRGDPAYAQLLADDPNAFVRDDIYADLAAMRRAADGVGHRLVVLSAYRSYAQQQATFDYWVGVGGYEQALRTSARPGHSEHQLGTTIDFGDGTAAPWEYEDWATTGAGSWLKEHAAEFGFTLTLARGRSSVTCYDYEPWHYRWVGRDLAMRLSTGGLVLREYQSITR